MHVEYLFKLVCDHSEGFEDGIRGPSDGDDSLRTVSFWDVDASAALQDTKVKSQDLFGVTYYSIKHLTNILNVVHFSK